jgi:hypothetical protein
LNTPSIHSTVTKLKLLVAVMMNVRGVLVDCGAALGGTFVGDGTAVGLSAGGTAVGLLVGGGGRVGLLIGRAVAVDGASVRLAVKRGALLGAVVAVARGVRVGRAVEVAASEVACAVELAMSDVACAAAASA